MVIIEVKNIMFLFGQVDKIDIALPDQMDDMSIILLEITERFLTLWVNSFVQ